MANLNESIRELSVLLEDVAAELDVPPSKYEDAKRSYDAVGDWLNREDSELAPFNPTIYPQGSFALGTAVKPEGSDHYDVDAVCVLELDQSATTQQALKEMVGRRLKEHGTYSRLLDPEEGKRRCWTLKYADGSKFHLDILPAVPDDDQLAVLLGVDPQLARHAIAITDNKTWDQGLPWPKSNPKGYIEWFTGRMRVELEKRRRAIALAEGRASVQDIPDYRVRTPLQRLIQILKRHRDVRYHGDDDKPISIIITTLAAQAYDNEEELGAALRNAIPRMRAGILQRDGEWWVPNPVNPRENFADKWKEAPRKAELFFEWLSIVERDVEALLPLVGRYGSGQQVANLLCESYGRAATSTAIQKHARRTGADSLVVRGTDRSTQFAVDYREPPRWPVVPRYSVTVRANARRDGWRDFNFANASRAVPKGFALVYTATTDVPWPFQVFWQVVNTGDEAAADGGLRGGFYPGQGWHGLERHERTLYAGRHWVECFIVKDDRCVARSGEFVLNVGATSCRA